MFKSQSPRFHCEMQLSYLRAFHVDHMLLFVGSDLGSREDAQEICVPQKLTSQTYSISKMKCVHLTI